MMNTESQGLLERFEQQRISPPDFHHCDHIQVAFEILEKYDFIEACARYASIIRAIAESVGAPEKYNATITLAFMSLIAERKSQADYCGFRPFIDANPDLLDKRVLSCWYSDERLRSDTARLQFLLPDRASDTAA